MNKTELIEYADYLLQTAMYKVDNIEDAEDLVQETLVEALVAIHQNKAIDNPKSWLVSVLHHKYYDMLRRKYRKGTVSMDVIGEVPVCEELSEQMERSEEAESIRCSLAYLTRIYRQVMVRYYIHGESIKQIAKALDIPENTVKSRLDTGRKHVRKYIYNPPELRYIKSNKLCSSHLEVHICPLVVLALGCRLKVLGC